MCEWGYGGEREERSEAEPRSRERKAARVIAAQVLDLVRQLAGPDAQAEVLVERSSLGLTRFANSYIHQNVADTTTTVRLRLHAGGRTAARTTTLTAPDGLRDLVARTREAARLCPPDPAWPGLCPPAQASGDGHVDERIVAASPADRAAQVRAFVDAAAGLMTAGYMRTQHWESQFANSAGQSATAATTEAAMDGIARTASSDGVGRAAGAQLSDVDGSVLGARAAAKARAGADPVELPPGRYEVVLEPAAVADILYFLAVYGFNGKAVHERRSFAELGEAQFDPSVTLLDDAGRAGAPGLPFDVQGTPKPRLELVAGGVTAALTHDRRTAATAGTRSTGHALGDGRFGAIATNLLLMPAGRGGASDDASIAALVSGVERGILVTDHWYTRVLDPKSLVVTGLTRNGVWLIEHGEPTRAVRNFRFTQSYPQALAPGAVLGTGSRAVTLPGAWPASGYTVPALRLASWHFSGGASG
jgi:predicted Zn-dependent protease